MTCHHDLNIDTTPHVLVDTYNSDESSIHQRTMPIPKPVWDQIRQIIPPLNGKLHKGQSGTFASNSPPALSYATQAVLEYSEGHSSTFPNLMALVNSLIEP